jgi:hypothetical protein
VYIEGDLTIEGTMIVQSDDAPGTSIDLIISEDEDAYIFRLANDAHVTVAQFGTLMVNNEATTRLGGDKKLAKLGEGSILEVSGLCVNGITPNWYMSPGTNSGKFIFNGGTTANTEVWDLNTGDDVFATNNYVNKMVCIIEDSITGNEEPDCAVQLFGASVTWTVPFVNSLQTNIFTVTGSDGDIAYVYDDAMDFLKPLAAEVETPATGVKIQVYSSGSWQTAVDNYTK